MDIITTIFEGKLEYIFYRFLMVQTFVNFKNVNISECSKRIQKLNQFSGNQIRKFLPFIYLNETLHYYSNIFLMIS